MSTLIEDSPRPFQAKWIADVVAAGLARGAVLTPFASPWTHQSGPGRKPGIRRRAEELMQLGVGIWFDATTHALQMGGVGDFRFYDQYDLWGGARGDLSTPALREEHARRVFAVQDDLGAPHLAPTVLLHAGLSEQSVIALELAKEAIAIDPRCRLTVAGTAPFWASGDSLDAHIGALSSLSPSGWFLTAAQTNNVIPVPTSAAEIHGLCRTTRALSEYAPVHISHGDLAGLPAIAAGAASVGTGWDKRQRVCAYVDYAPRSQGPSGGGWYDRVTPQGLVGSLSRAEATLLSTRDAARLRALGGMPAPGPKESFTQHVEVLHRITSDVVAGPDYQARHRILRDIYVDAAAEWPQVQSITRSDTSAAEWIVPLATGLALYGRDEGW